MKYTPTKRASAIQEYRDNTKLIAIYTADTQHIYNLNWIPQLIERNETLKKEYNL